MDLHIWIFFVNLILIAHTGFCDSYTIRPFIRSKYSQRWNKTSTVPPLILMDILTNSTSARNSTERPFIVPTTVALNTTKTIEPQQNISQSVLQDLLSVNTSISLTPQTQLTSSEQYERTTTPILNSTLPDLTENTSITVNTTENQVIPEEKHEITTTSILKFVNIVQAELTTKDQRENEIIDTNLSTKPIVHKKQHLLLQQNQFATTQSSKENASIPTLGDYDYY